MEKKSAVAPAGLFLVAVDRLPAWILPAYGSTWVAMPALDALAARGIVFDRLIATTDDPAATLADLLGGPGDPSPLVAAGARRGWRTALVTDDAVATLTGATVTRVVAGAKMVPEHDVEATCLARLCAAAGDVLTAGAHGNVIVHVTSLGFCWDAPSEFRGAYVDPEDPPPPAGADVPDYDVGVDVDPDLLVGIRQAFAGQLTLLDHCLGTLLAAAATARRTVLVTGLRGLALGLHGRVGPSGATPCGEVVHVPAILADGGERMSGQRYGGLVTPADLAATLEELLGVVVGEPDPARPWQGRSLAGLLHAWTSRPRDRVVSVAGGGAAIVTPAWHCMARGGRVELFAKPDDYFELCDVADRCSGPAEELGRLATAAAAGDAAAAWCGPLSAAAVDGTG